MGVEDPIEQWTKDEAGVLSERSDNDLRALSENLPGYHPGDTTEDLARRLEDQAYGVRTELVTK